MLYKIKYIKRRYEYSKFVFFYNEIFFQDADKAFKFLNLYQKRIMFNHYTFSNSTIYQNFLIERDAEV